MEIINYTETHKAYQKKIHSFIKKEIIPNSEQWEKDHIVPKEVWKKIGREGFLCPCVSTEYGGPGRDFLYSVITMEEMAKANQLGFFQFLHSDIVVPYIESYGTEEQKKKYLPGCVSGDIITAVAMTEPDAGSDLASMTGTAVENGDEVIINASKTFISNGINCDLVVVAVKDPSIENPHKAISLYLVENGTPGFEKGNQLEKMGIRCQDTAELFFSNCRIPKENRLGQKGAGFPMLMQKLQQERLVCSLMAQGIAEFILAWSIEYCKKTSISGAPLSKTQAVQFALAEMASEVKMSRTFIDKLVVEHMEQKNITTETSMAKFLISEMANRIANRCMDIVGDFAMDERCPLARAWRDIRVWPIFAGTNEIMRGIIAKSMDL